MKYNILIGGTAVVVALFGAVPVAAQFDNDARHNNIEQKIDERVKSSSDRLKQSREHTREKLRQLTTTHSDRVDRHKKELQKRLEADDSKPRAALEGRRLAQCQNRQNKINDLVRRSAANGKAQLAQIRQVEDGIVRYSENQALLSNDYVVALENVDAKRAEATASLDIIHGKTFDCKKIHSHDPAASLRASAEAKRVALAAYRDSVIELIRIVKHAQTNDGLATPVNTEGDS